MTLNFVYILLAVLIGFFALMIGMRIAIQFKASLLKGKSAPELTNACGKIIRENQKSLFYFYSPGCGACRSMTPVIRKLSETNRNIAAVDISSDMSTARSFSVMATPTLVLIDNGLIKDVFIGPQSASAIENLLA
jgi:thioredoxin 1